MKPYGLIEFCRRMVTNGIETFIFKINNVQELWQLERISEEAIPVVREFKHLRTLHHSLMAEYTM